MIIVPGPASKDLGFRIANVLGIEAAPIEFKRFPDGESYLRFTKNLEKEDVVIVQTTGPPQDINLFQLLLLIDAARDLGSKSVTAVVPYVAYGRQDKRFLSGEAISSKTVFKLLETVDIDYFITFDYHNPEILNYFKDHVENLSAIPSLANFMKGYNLKEAFSLAPDDGAIELVKVSSKILGGDFGWLKKTRDKVTGEITVEVENLDVKGKDAVIFDDIISTGSTMISAVKILKRHGARRVYAACVHPLLIGDAKDKILMEGALEIIGTDCVQSPVSVLSVAPVVAEALRRHFSR